MSTEPRKPLPPQFDPTLIFRAGQYHVKMQDQNGSVYEKIVSPAAVREAFTNEVIDSGWLPQEVRRYGICRFGEWFLAFLPPARYEIPLESDEEGAERGVVKIIAPLPGLIFFGCLTKYFVWAVKTEAFDPKAEVYHAPLPNVGMDSPKEPPGLICYGYHQPLKCRAATFMKAWQLFMETPFNNHTADGKSRKFPEDVRLMLRELAAQVEGAVGIDHAGSIVYPVDDLLPLSESRPLTVETFVKTWLLSENKQEEEDGITGGLLSLFEATRP
jgi:hypothetical protein